MRATIILPVTVATIAAVLVATLGATITDLGPWYQSLEQPSWNPPDAAFPMIWTLVFALITVAGITAWRAAPDRVSAWRVIKLFALNAVLNIGWSLLFFRLQRPDWAMAELVLLWLSIAVMIVTCWRYSKFAGALLVPYLIWVTIAGALNWEVVRLNGPFG